MQLQNISSKIYKIRGQKVMLDFDLAILYDVETKALKQAVKRNQHRFPDDFLLEITSDEYDSLRSQIVTLKNPGRGKHVKYLPFEFTEQGVAMLSSILRSRHAVEVNISIMRTFVYTRQFALSHTELTEKLYKLEEKFDRKFKDVATAIDFLLKKDQLEIEQIQRKKNWF